MQVRNINQTQKFTGMLNNKLLLSGLEKIADHGTSFAATTSLVMSLGVRPLAISMTPDVERENKNYAMSNSICSGLMKFGLVEAVALPVERMVKRIDENPTQFLKLGTIKKLQACAPHLLEAKSYKLATQMIKLGTGLLTAIPKSVLTVALIPPVMEVFFRGRQKKNLEKEAETAKSSMPDFKHFLPQNKPVAFTGSFSDVATKGVAKILDNKRFQNFVIKNKDAEKDVAKHMTVATDVLLTATSAIRTNRSKKIKETRKKVLIYNNIISTGITIGGLYGVESLFKSKNDKFIERFKKANALNPKLGKYVQGINILRPALIAAGIYYGVLPMFSTFIAEKIDKFVERKS